MKKNVRNDVPFDPREAVWRVFVIGFFSARVTSGRVRVGRIEWLFEVILRETRVWVDSTNANAERRLRRVADTNSWYACASSVMSLVSENRTENIRR